MLRRGKHRARRLDAVPGRPADATPPRAPAPSIAG